MSRLTAYGMTTALGALVALMGCGLEDPKNPRGEHSDAGVVGGDGGGGGAVPRPIIEMPTSGSNTCQDKVAIVGTAAKGASVFAVGGASTSGVATDAHPSTGHFCLPVDLKKGQSNTIEVRAQDPEKGLSEPAVLTVVHSGCTQRDDVKPPTTPTRESMNVAIGAQGKAKDTAKQGNETFLTDDKPSTVAIYGGGWAWADYDGWVKIKLDKPTPINKVVVKWRDRKGSGGSYGKVYSLWFGIGDTGDPSKTNGKWFQPTERCNVTDGDGGDDVFEFKTNKPTADSIALFLNHDGADWTWEETFAIAEIYVYDEPPKPTASPTPVNAQDVCSAVGTGY